MTFLVCFDFEKNYWFYNSLSSPNRRIPHAEISIFPRVMVVGCRGGVNINPRHLMMPEVFLCNCIHLLYSTDQVIKLASSHLQSNVSCTQASICGVALGTTSPAEWAEMGVAIFIIHPIRFFPLKYCSKSTCHSHSNHLCQPLHLWSHHPQVFVQHALLGAFHPQHNSTYAIVLKPNIYAPV